MVSQTIVGRKFLLTKRELHKSFRIEQCIALVQVADQADGQQKSFSNEIGKYHPKVIQHTHNRVYDKTYMIHDTQKLIHVECLRTRWEISAVKSIMLMPMPPSNCTATKVRTSDGLGASGSTSPKQSSSSARTSKKFLTAAHAKTRRSIVDPFFN